MRHKLFGLLALMLAGCSTTTPPEWSTWQTTTHGVTVQWHFVRPHQLGASYAGMARMESGTCNIYLDPTALTPYNNWDILAPAHEWAHCWQFAHPGELLMPRPDIREYFAPPVEGGAQTYALAYLAACGRSLAPLGWPDARPAACAGPPDPREVADKYNAPANAGAF